jgi:hypothetical protein
MLLTYSVPGGTREYFVHDFGTQGNEACKTFLLGTDQL